MGQYGRGGVASSSKARKVDRGPAADSAEAYDPRSADDFMTAEEIRMRDAAVKMANKSLVYPDHMSGEKGKKKKRLKRRKAFKKAHEAKVREAINQVGRLRDIAATRGLNDWKSAGRGSAKAYKRGTPEQILAARDTSRDNIRQDQRLRQWKDWGGSKSNYSAKDARKRSKFMKDVGLLPDDAEVNYSDRTKAIHAARERGDRRDNWLEDRSEGPVQFGGVSSGDARYTRNAIFNAERGRFGSQWGDTPETRLDTRDEFLGFGSDRDQVEGGLTPLNRNVRTVTRHNAPTYRPTAAERRRGNFTTVSNRTATDGRHLGIGNAERAYAGLSGGTYRR